jgi:hypothetical protein
LSFLGWFQGWAESEVSNCPLSITFLIEFHDYLIQVLRWSQMKKIQAIFLSNKTCPIDHRKNLCVLENKNKMQNTKNASDSSFEITFQNTYFLAKQIKDISSVYFPFCTLSQLCNIIELATNLGQQTVSSHQQKKMFQFICFYTYRSSCV